MKKHNNDFITLGFNFSSQELKKLTDQLDEIQELTKNENGSQKSNEGHSISYSIKGREVFFAMIHSNKKSYLVRADKNLFTQGS